MGFFLVAFGALGLLGMTVLFPCLAFLVQAIRSGERKTSVPPSSENFTAIDILIPAHNEALTLPATLAGVRQAIEHMKTVHPDFRGRIIVAADACTDDTAKVATAHGADTVAPVNFKNKWLTLNFLFSDPDRAPWVALVDCATLWPQSLLVKAEPLFTDRRNVGILPGCHVNWAGLFGHLAWTTERILKSLESALGGPVAIYGPTVIYRTEALRKAVAQLGTEIWVNDDVVIPLMLRALNPEARLPLWTGDGPSDWVIDNGLGQERNDFLRRRRIIIGNLQWINHLLGRTFRLNPTVGILAMRRVFRVFWFYWILFLITGFALVCFNHQAVFDVAVFLVATITLWHLILPAKKGVRSLLMVSLLAPIYFLRSRNAHLTGWK